MALKRDHLDEIISACADHSWNNEKFNYRHRREFQEAGIKSQEELRQAIDRAVKDVNTRSFDRQPEPARGQTEPSIILQAKVFDSNGKERPFTVVLNPDRDSEGNLHGGTAYLNDPKRRDDIHRHRQFENDKGHDPKFVLRGENLHQPAAEAVRTPGERFIGKQPPAFDPKHSREQTAQERRQEPSAKPASEVQAKKSPGLYEQYISDLNTRGPSRRNDR